MTQRSQTILRESIPSIVAAVVTSGIFGSFGVYVSTRLMAAEIVEMRRDIERQQGELDAIRSDVLIAERATTAKLETITSTITEVAKDVAYLRGKAEREQKP